MLPVTIVFGTLNAVSNLTEWNCENGSLAEMLFAVKNMLSIESQVKGLLLGVGVG